MTFPFVHDEFATIAKVAEGYSLARFGDGELKICHGSGYARESANAQLTAALYRTMCKPHESCIIGLPTYDPAGPKYDNWLRHKDRFLRILPERREWYSAFVSRPDSAPWIFNRAYGEAVQALWKGKRVAVVCEDGNSIHGTVALAAGEVVHVPCPSHNAFAVLRDLESQVRRIKPDIAILSAGPTATILANNLASRGIHAVDLGSAGGFLRKSLEMPEW